MAGAQAVQIVAVEILIKQYQVPEVRVPGITGIAFIDRAMAGFVWQKDADQALGQAVRYLGQGIVLSGTGGKFYLKVLPIILVHGPQGVDQHVVHRKPNRSPPVGVAAKHARGRFPGFIAYAIVLFFYFKGSKG